MNLEQWTLATMSLTPSATFAANPTTARAQSTKLSASPKGDKVVYAQGRCVVIRDLEVGGSLDMRG